MESSDNEDDLNFIENQLIRRPKVLRNRIDHFEIWDDYDFFTRFRLSKETVRLVVNDIEDQIKSPTDWNHALTPDQMVLLTLRFYAAGSFLNTVGDLTGVHKSTASKIVKKVSRAIASLRPIHIKLPTTAEEIRRIRQGFYNIAQFPKVIGTIDCTHVKIIQSPGGENGEIFRNRKNFFSLNVQTVSDHELKIRDIVCRWPGSSHDSQIFNNSVLRRRFEHGQMGDNLLLGDSGYRNRNFLITPLLNPLTPAENLFNESHIRTRNTVERQYGVWKRRFPVLANGIRLKLTTVQDVIMATAILHNIACDENEALPPIDADQEAAIYIANNVPAINYGNHIGPDNRIRNTLIHYFQTKIN